MTVTGLLAVDTGIAHGGRYVAAAYLVFLALVLVYVAIMSSRLVRIERKIGEVADLLDGRDEQPANEPALAASGGGE